MKKLLSLILAITMIAAFIPTAFAADGDAATVTYTFGNKSWIERGHPETGVRSIKSTEKEFDTPVLTNTEWAYLGSSFVTPASNNAVSAEDPRRNFVVGNHKSGVRAIAGTKGEWMAFKLEVPESGNYSVSVNALHDKNATSDLDMYLFASDTKVSVGNFNNANLVDVFADSSVHGTFEGVKDGETIVGCVRKNAQNFEKFVFDGSINPDDYKVIGNANLKSEVQEAKTVSGASSKNITLNAGVYVFLLVANEAGEVYIESLTLTAEPEAEQPEEDTPVELSGNIAFAAGADIQYKIGEGSYTNIAANNTAQIPVGSSVTVKVTDPTNFAGWVRGTADSGVWVSSDPEYKFNIMSPTYLTPIYTTPEETATHAVEFWDENGAYVETIAATDGKAVLPTSGYGLVGGEFSGWWINATTQLLANDEVAEGITRAVAKYNYGTFGTKVENNNNTATYWKRGDDIVAYGTSYDFYQWNGTPTITFGTEEITQNPLVVIDSTPVDGAYMIEYDKGNASEIVEAGILFGSDTDINIGSTDGSKAASQRNGVDDNVDDGHGQFCAKPNLNGAHVYARGYLIYRGTDEKLYVIYTDAVATTAQ
ncbi:MAG: hypothetical protein E7441_03680 [Ruminococcaceae bacterium]|nr:hypothetical protein [Oscillospiraceae bacterium]